MSDESRRSGMELGTCSIRGVYTGVNVTYFGFVNLYGCKIGDDTNIGALVEIQRNASVGKRFQDLVAHLHL